MDRVTHLQKINRLNDKIVDDDKKGNLIKIHTFAMKKKDDELKDKLQKDYVKHQNNLKIEHTKQCLARKIHTK